MVAESSNPFVDVAEGDYFYNAVLWAYANGITSGVTVDHFAPNAMYTRAEIVSFLYQAYK